MKKLHLGKTAAMLAIAISTLQCSKAAPETGTSHPQAGESKSAAPENPPSDRQPQDLLSTIEASRGDDELVVLMPGDATKQLEAELIAKNIPVRVLRDQSRNPQYYANQLIPHLRKQESQSLWFVFDHTDKDGSDALELHFLSVQRVTFRKDFANLTLTRVVNELVDRADEQLVSLELVVKTGSTVTNIVFSPDGETMFSSLKHGVINWNSTTSNKAGVSLKLPRAKKGVAGAFSSGESGLIGFALHPEFPETRKAYTHCNWQLEDGKRQAVVAEWDINEQHEMSNPRELMTIPQPRTDHNGGQLLFGPEDGYLYIGVGDGGEGKHTIGRAPAHTFRGKVFRIDPSTPANGKPYSIPADNPFLGHESLPPETFAWGFRNPWRMCFLPDGRLIAGDIGEDVNEEITFVVKGAHHGWPYVEGTHKRNKWTLGDQPLQPTLLAYERTMGMSVIGGAYYSGDELADLKDRYIWCDFISGRIWSIAVPASTDTSLTIENAQLVGQWPLLITTFGQSPSGEIFLGTNTGAIYRMTPPTSEGAGRERATVAALDDSVAQGMFATEFTGPEAEASAALAALGASLYSDKRLSRNGATSCATCHALDNYGQDGKQFSQAPDGTKTRRNTPTTFNAHRQFAQFWDYRAETVEALVAEKLIKIHGFADEAELVAKVSAIPELTPRFAETFADEANPVTATNISAAIGAFVRRLTTRSRWDDYLEGNFDALTQEEKVGLATFVDVGCVTCHQFRGLGGSMPHKLGLMKPWQGDDRGHALLTNEVSHEYYFKVPPLYNIEKTAPYLHDGSIETLEEVVSMMAEYQLNRKISNEEVGAIVAFLKTMTGGRPEIAKQE